MTQLPLLQKQLSKIRAVRQNDDNKMLVYQHKILQLLVRQKTMQLNFDQASKKFKQADKRCGIVSMQKYDLQQQINNKIKIIQQLEIQINKVTSHNDQLDLDCRMANVAKVQLEERVEKLEEELNAYKIEQDKWNKQQSKYQQQIDQLRQINLDQNNKLNESERNNKKANEQLIIVQNNLKNSYERLEQKQENLKKINGEVLKLNQLNTNLTEKVNQLTNMFDEKEKSFVSLKERQNILDKQVRSLSAEREGSVLRVQELERQVQTLKAKRDQAVKELRLTEQSKESLETQCKKMQRELKKMKEQLKNGLQREKDLGEEVELNRQKIKGLQKTTKSLRRQVEELNNSLLHAQQSKGTESQRIKKYETIVKANKQKLQQMQDQLQQTKQLKQSLKAKLQTSEKSVAELSFELDKLKKEKQMLSEMIMQTEEKRILGQSQKQKAITQIIKEKDVLNRANFKLFQLLEMKDKAIQKIVEGCEANADRFEIQTDLGSNLLADFRKNISEDKYGDGKARLSFLSNWMAKHSK